ncbi:MAG TPA: DUF4440 domain-containing protein [Gammaproteobacteria bacterium]|jgi:uncharacterized protein (TIGR02246 family)|nr:DUF4440 domain-containing protein [Gammaproteobacteria bacterium]
MISRVLVACGLVLSGFLCDVSRAARPEELTSDPAILGFLQRLADATESFNKGDPAPYVALMSPTSDLTLMGGAGGYEKGITQIKPRLEFITQQRRSDGNKATIDYISIVAVGDMAYTVAIERRLLRASGQSEPVKDELRATTVLRREQGEWRLIHRHADPLVQVTVPGIRSSN